MDQSVKEVRIKSITSIYYSKPEVQKALVDFSAGREVVPRYFESFGKRPDTIQYPSDIIAAVKRGATSFHASEEIWRDPLMISTDSSPEEIQDLRTSWDLLLDIDSPYLDYSKIAAELLVNALEKYGITSYGIKFSGSKGFHIIVPGNAFPQMFEDQETHHMFPDWPRAISEFLLAEIRPEYNRRIAALGVNFEAVESRLNITKEELVKTACPNCSRPVRKGWLITYKCDKCKNQIERPVFRIVNKKLRCIDPICPGFYEKILESDYFICEHCKLSSLNKTQSSSAKIVHEKSASQGYSGDFKEEISGELLGSLDLVLVSPRHLFRAPYSLHEKTSLASIVIKKDQIPGFVPKDADPLNVKVLNYYPQAHPGEASRLLATAVKWKQSQINKNKPVKKEQYEDITISGVTEEMFPAPIKKLLNGLSEGKKRGLFILITFLRAVNFSPEYINAKIREWNEKNKPPLKEGYIKSQIDWHLRQKRKILPPNYDNPSFYKDLNLLDKPVDAKNPLSEVIRNMRKSS